MLERGGRADGEEVVDFADALGDGLFGDGPADPPAGDGVGLGDGVDGDGAVGHAGQCGERDVLGAVVEDVLVYLVGDGVCIPFLAEVGNLLELGAGEDFAGGVVGGVDDDGFGFGVEGGGKLFGPVGPFRRVEGDVAGGGAGEDAVGAVVFVEGLEDDDLVAGVDEGLEGGDHGFGGAAGDGDVGDGVAFDAVVGAGLAVYGGAQLGLAVGDGVLVEAGVDGDDGGFFYGRRAFEVWEALRQVVAAGGVADAGHLADDGFGEGFGDTG